MFKNVLIILIGVACGAGLVMWWSSGQEVKPSSDNTSETDSEETTDVEEDAENADEEREEADEAESNESDIEPQQQIIGTWYEQGESQRVSVFAEDGTLRESYGAGAVVEEGTYQVFTDRSDLPDEAAPDAEEDEVVAYLREVFGDTNYFYAIQTLTDETLELRELPGGEIYQFTRDTEQ